MSNTLEEKEHLLRDYLQSNPRLKYFGGFSALSLTELKMALRSLEAFDKPDMYAEVGQKTIAIEHFEFDASVMNRKGMKGKAEESHLQKAINMTTTDSFSISTSQYSTSFENWRKNFETCFDHHYQRIDEYWKNVDDKVGISPQNQCVMGFFIENQYSPYVYLDNQVYELYYICTRQFLDFFQAKTNVDFILYGTYSAGVLQIFYMDHQHLMPIDKAVDLFDPQKAPELLDINEATIYGDFGVSTEEINE